MDKVNAGDPCPKCGGTIVGVCNATFSNVPIDANGYHCLDGEYQDGELIFAECGDCGIQFDVEFPQLKGERTGWE